MALTQGVKSLFPCPRCLIPKDDQGDASAKAPLRTTAGTRETIQEARGKQLLQDRKSTLKAVGLRDVDVRLCSHHSHFILLLTTPKNVFWKVDNSDPYDALSFDRLHTNPGGLFRHHLWPRLQAHIKALEREVSADINAMYVLPSRFTAMSHYSS